MSGNRGLGKGLDALLKGYQAEPSSMEVKVIPVHSIEPNPYQPRREFSEKALEDLAESIRTQGVLQPILVRHHPSKRDGAYELVAGERRWRASQLAQKDSIPALIRELSDEESLAIALIENLQREDLNPIEEALGLRQLQQQFTMNQETLAARIGKSRSAVANTLRLLQLPEHIQKDIKLGNISAGHARSLLAITDAATQESLRKRILDPGLTVRETEAQVNYWKEHGVLPDATTMSPKPAKGKRAASAVAEPLLALQEQMSLSTHMKVKFKGNEDKGQIVLKYTSRDQLAGLLTTLGIEANKYMQPISKDILQRSLYEFADKQVLIVGDAMIDKYVVGAVNRINPEAPVPVVEVQQERFVLGGAANVARNIQSLGGKPFLISVTGNDATADLLKEQLDRAGIAHKLIGEQGRMTTIKTRVMASNQQIVRVDYETPHETNTTTQEELLASILEFLEFTDVLILSDYGKGIVTESFMNELRNMMRNSTKKPKILVDPKVRNFSLYTDTFILTPNAKEALEGANLHAPASGIDVLQTGDAIFDKLNCEHLLITLGARGMALFASPGKVYQIPTMGQKVFDVCGAGDTVISTLGLSLAAGHDLLVASVLANYAAGLVVGEVGTACTTIEAIHDSIDQLPMPEIAVLRS